LKKTSSLSKLVPLIRKDVEMCYLKIKSFYQKHGSKWTIREFSAKDVDGTRVSEKFGNADSLDDEDLLEDIGKAKQKKSSKSDACSTKGKAAQEQPLKNVTKHQNEERSDMSESEEAVLPVTKFSTVGNKTSGESNSSSKSQATNNASSKTANQTPPNSASVSSSSKKTSAKEAISLPEKQLSIILDSDGENVETIEDEEEEEERPSRVRARVLSQEIRSDSEEEEEEEETGSDLEDFLEHEGKGILARDFLSEEAHEDNDYEEEEENAEEEENDDLFYDDIKHK